MPRSSNSSGLAVDGLDPPDRVGAQVGVLEQPGQPRRAAFGEAVEGLRIGLRQVERGRPPVLVVQQRVPAAQVGQRLDPLLLGGPDELQTPTVIILGHARPPTGTRRHPSSPAAAIYPPGRRRKGPRPVPAL